MERYPDIGAADPALNLAFVDVFNPWKAGKPEVLQRDDWPEIVAAEAVNVWTAPRRSAAGAVGAIGGGGIYRQPLKSRLRLLWVCTEAGVTADSELIKKTARV
ncbi:MAG: hypothetical protein P4L99_02615 [Chthoniobacter sp.]|nr:hypothetical protein [Chthoniobacter sp.]